MVDITNRKSQITITPSAVPLTISAAYTTPSAIRFATFLEPADDRAVVDYVDLEAQVVYEIASRMPLTGLAAPRRRLVAAGRLEWKESDHD